MIVRGSHRANSSLFLKITYLIPDAGEAGKLAGFKTDSAENGMRAAQHLLEQGVQNPCIKLKDGGCVLMNYGKTLPIAPVQVIAQK